MSSPTPLLPPQIFSARRQHAAFRRAVLRQQRPDAARFLFTDMLEEVKERLSFMQFTPQTALILGDPTRLLGEELKGHGAAVSLVEPGTWMAERPLGGDQVDLVLCDTSLGAINDLPGALLHLRQALRPGGLLLASILGAGSLQALRSAILAAEPDRPHSRVHPQIDNRTASALLHRAGFARQVVDSHSLTVRYRRFAALVTDLRDQGLGSVLAHPAPSLLRSASRRAAQAFTDLADADSRVSERFEIITLTAWRS